MELSKGKVFVFGISDKMDIVEFSRHFSSNGKIKNVEIQAERHLGTVTYVNPADALLAVQKFNETVIEGNIVHVVTADQALRIKQAHINDEKVNGDESRRDLNGRKRRGNGWFSWLKGKDGESGETGTEGRGGQGGKGGSGLFGLWKGEDGQPGGTGQDAHGGAGGKGGGFLAGAGGVGGGDGRSLVGKL